MIVSNDACQNNCERIQQQHMLLVLNTFTNLCVLVTTVQIAEANSKLLTMCTF